MSLKNTANEDKLMAAAIMGESDRPKAGYKILAATGTPTAL